MRKLIQLPILLLTVCSFLIACGDDSNQYTLLPKLTIVFNNNGGSGSMEEQTILANQSANLSANSFDREGYTFKGWAYSETGEVEYEDEENYAVGSLTENETVTLYAVWTANTSTINFNVNGGTGGPDTTFSVEAVFGSPMPSLHEQTLPTREKRGFTGYFDAPIDGTMYYMPNLISVRTWDKDSNATLYAQWRDEGVYELGDGGPGGGIIFYKSEEGFMVTGYDIAHYLEAAPVDAFAKELMWASSDFFDYFIDVLGTEIGRGRDNTNGILAVDADAPAARACVDYAGGGKTDWFLPSIDELYQLYLQKNIVGDFSTDCYWSSSEYASDYVWVQYFDRTRYYSSKNSKGRVRAIRAF